MIKHKICVVGGGYWGTNHIKTLHELDCLGGVVEPDKSKHTYIEDNFPETKIFSSLEESFNEHSFEGYTVATPAETHYDIGIKILNEGKNVLIEKPLTLDLDQAVKLCNLSKDKSLTLMVGHLLLFHPAIIKIKDMIRSGAIGKLQYIYSNRLNLGQVRANENVFWSLAPHDISIFQFFTNLFPEEINAHGSSFLQEGIYDSTITSLKYPNKIEGHIFVSWLHPFKEHRLVVIGSEGMLCFEDSQNDKPLKHYSKKFDIGRGLPEKIDGPVEILGYNDAMPLKEELAYFINNLYSKDEIISGADHALEVTKILIKASNQLK